MATYNHPTRRWHGLPLTPTTALGRRAVLLAVVSGIGFLVALPAVLFAPTDTRWVPWGILLVVGLIPGLVCAIAASIVAFLAMVRRGERALGVYVGFVPVACILLSAAINSLFAS